MSLKEFIKPSRRKLLIFIVLLFLSTTPHLGYNYVESTSFPSILTIVNGKPSTCPPDCINFYEINRIIWPIYPLYTFQTISSSPKTTVFIEYELLLNPDSYGGSLNGYEILISNLIYWYLLSCIIVWIWYNFCKKVCPLRNTKFCLSLFKKK